MSKTKTKKTKVRAKQMEIPGTERPKIEEVEATAEEYTSLRDRRMAVLKEEVTAKTKLLDAMHKYGLTIYRYDDRIVEVQPAKEKVKVKSIHDEDEDGEDE